MTDLRRSILWGVFLVSLVLLWDAWNRHNGQPSMFGPAPSRAAAPASAPAGAATAATVGAAGAGTAAPGVPTPTPSATPGAASAVPGPTAAAPAAAPAELITVTTDVVRAVFDTRGAQLVKMELLKHVDHNNSAGGVVVLFDRSKDREYLAQTGLV